MKLYEIADTYRAFMAAVDAGEIPEDAVVDTLDGIEGEFEAKADKYSLPDQRTAAGSQGHQRGSG